MNTSSSRKLLPVLGFFALHSRNSKGNGSKSPEKKPFNCLIYLSIYATPSEFESAASRKSLTDKYLRRVLTRSRTRYNIKYAEVIKETVNYLTDSTYSGSDRFLQIRQRFARRFRERSVQSWHAIQYWLCEVGVPPDREDPRAIQPALSIRGTPLKPSDDTEARPWEPTRGLFVSPDLPARHANEVIDHHVDALRLLSKLLSERDTRTIAENVREGLKISSAIESLETRRVELCENVGINSSEVLVDLSQLGGGTILGLVTNDPEWLYPDDPRLWRHLARCRVARAYPVFIARKISIATFPVLKQVSALGVQLHQLLLRDDLVDEATRIQKELSWISLAGVEKTKNHPALNAIRNNFAGITRSFALQLAYDNISAGVDMGLDHPSSASPDRLLKWATSARVPLPDKWFATIHDWTAWDARRLLRKPYEERTWPIVGSTVPPVVPA